MQFRILFSILISAVTSFRLFSIAKKSNFSKKSSLALQKAVIKPLACGAKYFQNLEEQFVLNFDPQIASEPLRISQYCQKFSSENDVTVNILDAQGIDMCSFRNPISALYAQFFTLLNQRNTEDRYNYYTTYLIGLVPLPSDDPNFDIVGIANFYRMITFSATYTLIYNSLLAQIANINQYENSGNQGVAIIQQSSAITAAVASFPANHIAYEYFLLQMNDPYDLSRFTDPAELTSSFLRLYFSDARVEPESISLLISNLSKEKIIVLSYLGTFGIIKNQASPLYINAIQDGVCYWAENHFFGPYGMMYRIVLSQPKSNILLP